MGRRLLLFREVRTRLPEPSPVEIRPGLHLNTLHFPGSEPPLVFLHGGLGNLWDAYLQLDGLQQIDVPVYVVHGSADRIVPMKRARVTAQLFPDGTFLAGGKRSCCTRGTICRL